VLDPRAKQPGRPTGATAEKAVPSPGFRFWIGQSLGGSRAHEGFSISCPIFPHRRFPRREATCAPAWYVAALAAEVKREVSELPAPIWRWKQSFLRR